LTHGDDNIIISSVSGGGSHHANKSGAVSVGDAQGMLEAGGVGRLTELTHVMQTLQLLRTVA